MPPRPGSSSEGDTLDHYRLIESIGRGGMGEVFLAEDSRLGRQVAIKVLGELSGDRRRLERFETEVRTLASLNHPGIVTVYSVQTDGPSPYFTMELVQGRTLAELIAQGGLGERRFLDLAIQMADALGAAHQKGVTHRDLKPANVMIAEPLAGGEERVKILDFGLARLEPASSCAEPDLVSTAALSSPGLVLGTLPYMAPEQLSGAADARTDIFSLGVIFYESLSGRRPFAGETAPELMAAILRSEPVPLSRLRPDLSWRLSEIVHRCLRKDPRRRPQSALDVRNDLEDLREGAGVEGARLSSIAVLPFRNMSSAEDQEYFCEGIAAELITALNRIDGLRVAPRASSFQYRGEVGNLAAVGRELSVDVVLDGSVRRSDGRVRVTVELIDVESGFDLWSERFDREIEDVFAIEDEIAQRIAELLEVSLSSDLQAAIRSGRTGDLEAYDFFLQGRKYFDQYNQRSVEFALELFERAIQRDPGYARAWTGIADCHSYLFLNADRREVHLAEALTAVHRALELDPESAEAVLSLAVVLSYGGDRSEAEEAFELAIGRAPASFDAHYFYARHCFACGELERSIALYERAAEIRPDDFQGPLLSAQIYEDLGRPDAARSARERGIRLAERRLGRAPDDIRALYQGANGLVALGESERGLRWAERAHELGSQEPMLLYNLACIYSLAGRRDDALQCLEDAVAGGFAFTDWIEGDNNLDPIRDEPRYRRTLERLRSDAD